VHLSLRVRVKERARFTSYPKVMEEAAIFSNFWIITK
jgi:hypothetical protein